MSGFNNPIVGGGGALVYPSIHSPNFVTGVSGWTIDKDGSAEFDDLTLRGTFTGTDWVIDSAGAFFYSGPPALGNLVASVTNQHAADPFGNAVLTGIASYTGAAPNLRAIAEVGGGLSYFRATGPAGPWTFYGQLGFTGVGADDLNLFSDTRVISSAPQTVISPGFIAAITGRALEVQGDAAMTGTLRAVVGGLEEGWHYVGTPVNPAFQNFWNNSGSGSPLAYQLRTDQTVDIYGDLTVPVASPNTTIFTLPAAYRPAAAQQLDLLVVSSAGGAAQVNSWRAFAGTSGAVTVGNVPNTLTAARVALKGKLYLDL